MNSVKKKIANVIRDSNGYPNYTREEYINAIKLSLNEEFSNEELGFVQAKKIALDKWIMAITKEITEDLF